MLGSEFVPSRGDRSFMISLSFLGSCALCLALAPPDRDPVPEPEVLELPRHEQEADAGEESVEGPQPEGAGEVAVEIDPDSMVDSPAYSGPSLYYQGASPSFRLAMGGSFHPSTKRKRGFTGEFLVGGTFWFEELSLVLWPEIGVGFGSAEHQGEVSGIAQVGAGLFSVLYYHVGFEGGQSVDGLGYGPRHGPSLRILHIVGVDLVHEIRYLHAGPAAPVHQLSVMLSIEPGVIIGLANGIFGSLM